MKLITIFLTLLFSLPLLGNSRIILKNGKISTANPTTPEVQAVVIDEKRIIFVGSNEEAIRYENSYTKTIDLAGKRVVPGLMDGHAHVKSFGFLQRRLNLVGTKSLSEVVAQVKSRIKRMKKSQWLRGRGWDQNDWPNTQFPNKTALDKISPNNPIYLSRIDGHAAFVNSMALKKAGINKHTKDPSGGKIIRDKNGQATGILIDNAMDLVTKHIPSPSRNQAKAAMISALNSAASLGLTGIHDAGVNRETIEIYKELLKENNLPIRVNAMLSYSNPAYVKEYFKKGPEVLGEGRLTIRSVKLFADGALGSRGAALLQPYSDDPKNSGLLLLPAKEIRALASEAIKSGFQLATHAIGDRANHIVLNSYEDAIKKSKTKDHRFRIEHAQIIDEKDIARFADLNVIASMQATHCTSDMPWVYSRIGESRAKEGAYVWQKILKAGVKLANGSDAPVESLDPMLGIYAAITRQDHKASPKGGWHNDQILSREQALASFTTGPAYAAKEEVTRGSIEVGKRADLVVLTKDIMTIPPREILNAKALYTILDGKIIYSRITTSKK